MTIFVRVQRQIKDNVACKILFYNWTWFTENDKTAEFSIRDKSEEKGISPCKQTHYDLRTKEALLRKNSLNRIVNYCINNRDDKNTCFMVELQLKEKK